MTKKRYMLDDTGELIDLNNHQFIDYGDMVCNLLNDFNDENRKLKDEKHMLLAEIKFMQRQGAETSERFQEYLDRTSSDWDKFWQRKLKQARKDMCDLSNRECF